jgi:hypothetical protein
MEQVHSIPSSPDDEHAKGLIDALSLCYSIARSRAQQPKLEAARKTRGNDESPRREQAISPLTVSSKYIDIAALSNEQVLFLPLETSESAVEPEEFRGVD